MHDAPQDVLVDAYPEEEYWQDLLKVTGGATDEALRSKVDELAESAVRSVANQFHEEAAELISGTIARWDSAQASQKLESLLGRDLQFIRINGTVVGGLAGLVIHLITQAV